ncbi:5-formyltetrahydrofolate cyclo-ligase [Rothia sp. CCM 9418]|uniref:5-formyltetrahydrofolate cyclo-ligase n=1 Tax=Rothia sp. CCM 9418 TaxID=3402661 RepID=UPI003ADBDDAB
MSFQHQHLTAYKAALRSNIREQRRIFSSRKDAQNALDIQLNKLVESLALPQKSIIAAFLPLPTEPPILQGLKTLNNRGYTIIVPITTPQKALLWAPWTTQSTLHTNSLGISEPAAPYQTSQAFYNAQLRLIPALAIGADGRRLGQGGGYYDRLLADDPAPDKNYGITYSWELLPSVPAEPWDAKLLHVLTENGVRELSVQ